MRTVLEQLEHNGIVVPAPPEPRGLVVNVRGVPRPLSPKEEEMVMAFAAKKDTDYVRDDVFVANFMSDLSAEMGIAPPLRHDEIDWEPLHRIVDEEREARARLTAEERKAGAAARKAAREEMKATYGYAIVNGRRVELGNYMTEPSGIFMGRGEHPLRGRWKEGAQESDVTLNLSPDAATPLGQWEQIVWQPESMWVARWKDKLSDKLKYVWLGDTAPLKQEREKRKFDKAIRLDTELDRVRARIEADLRDERPLRRRIATACYLIDALCLRVGDEKDPDEADTVGATTLRPEHVHLLDSGLVEFRFLGKDSVEWHRQIELPEQVRANLKELIEAARPSEGAARDLAQIFPNVSSRTVNSYLSSIVPGLSAKVFRTHHATVSVRRSLEESGVRKTDPEYKKWRAASLANVSAAILCNHNRKATGDWKKALERYAARRGTAQERIARADQAVQAARGRLDALREDASALPPASEATPAQVRARQRYNKRIATAKRQLAAARQRKKRAQDALGKVNSQQSIAGKKRTWNLSTSLKSYIDPRVYHAWGQRVDYDVLERYYPATLRRKYLWVRADDESAELPAGSDITVRPCMASDLGAVVALFAAAKEEHPHLDLPLAVDDVAERYLPSLGGAWKEAAIALDEEQIILAFAALGPEWTEGGEDLVDVLAINHPQFGSEALSALVAHHLNQALAARNALTPRKTLQLRPQDGAWLAAMPEMAEALGLDEYEDDEPQPAEDEDSDESDSPDADE